MEGDMVGGRYVHIILALPICSVLRGVSSILMIFRTLSSRCGVLLQFGFLGNVEAFSYFCRIIQNAHSPK